MDVDQFLLEDLRLKVDYLNAHFQRMWTRFNFFVTIEAVLVGFLFSSGANAFSGNAIYLAFVEAFLSIIWWVFGAQDRYLVRFYRDQVRNVAERIAITDEKLSYYRHRYVSATPEELEHDPYAIKHAKRWSLLEWRLEPLSITRLAALFPLIILLLWLLVIIILLSQKL
ncbi:MAG: hypothetical protein ACJ8CB_01415 [Ktedonobacteraceae bacterium]